MTTAEECIQAALSGADMRVFLSPNPDLSFSVKEAPYIECYDLPFVLINKDTIWGSSRRSHLNHSLGSDHMVVHAFSYSPNLPFYGCSNYGSVGDAVQSDAINLKLMPISHYKELNFVMPHNYEPVWRYGDDEFTKVEEAIRGGKKFKIALQIDLERWVITPVDLGFFYDETKSLKIRPEIDFLPHLFLMADHLVKLIGERRPDFLMSDNPNRDMEMRVKNYCTFNMINSDGTYYNLKQIPDSTNSPYQDAILFAEIAHK